MKYLNAILIIIILSILLLTVSSSVLSSNGGLLPGTPCVPNEEVAVQIANIILGVRFSGKIDFDLYYTVVEYREDLEAWRVSYRLYSDAEGGKLPVVGGGGPNIIIKKQNAEVIAIFISL